MIFSDLQLSRRLERTEGYSAVQYAEAHARVRPESGACWIQSAGGYVIFDGSESPITQTFGLGLFEELTPSALSDIEKFFSHRSAPVSHEISPFVGLATLNLLCQRNYRPIEISNVLYQPIVAPPARQESRITVRTIAPEESSSWTEVNSRGWGHEHPELRDFLLEHGIISAARAGTVSFLAELDGQPGGAGALCLHEGVALFAGATAVPELRRRGLQHALLEERMRYAAQHGCDLAMMVTEAGSGSQRNAERNGFRVAYTRMKWRWMA